MSELIQNFHFLRPLWLLAFIPILALVVWAWYLQNRSKLWSQFVDAKLQPFVLLRPSEQSSGFLRWFLLFALLLSALSLAGPVWQKLPQAVYKPQSALVIVLDMSKSMDAQDIKPSRLARAKLKIIDLLSSRKEGQTALVVYAANAFTVSPLTDDSETIVSLLKSLSTDIMPAQGSRVDQAVTLAADLLQQSAIAQGHILLVSDGLSGIEKNALSDVEFAQHSVSVLAVGSEQGAPIPLANGGFLNDRLGNIVIAKMNRNDLMALAQQGSGVFATLRHDDADIDALTQLFGLSRFKDETTLSDQQFDIWYEPGSWLLLLVLPIVALVFRKGLLGIVVALVLVTPDASYAFEVPDWLTESFKNDNQKAAEKFSEQQYELAEQQFKRLDWRAAAQFNNAQYEQALAYYQSQTDVESRYNSGNALAQLQRFDEAIAAWDDVLKMEPDHQDALFNKKKVEDFLKQQKQQKQQQQSDESQQSSDDERQQQDNEQQGEEGQNTQQQQAEQSENQSGQQDEQSSTNDNNEKEEAEASQAESEEQQSEQSEQSLSDDADVNKEQQIQSLDQQEQEPLDEMTKQWLRRVPDDPGGLMRNKFLYQYKQLDRQKDEQNPW